MKKNETLVRSRIKDAHLGSILKVTTANNISLVVEKIAKRDVKYQVELMSSTSSFFICVLLEINLHFYE